MKYLESYKFSQIRRILEQSRDWLKVDSLPFRNDFKLIYTYKHTNSKKWKYGQWDESRRSNLQLRFASSETIDGDTIIVNVSGFKYKTYMMDRFKSIRLSDEEKAEAVKCIEQKVKNSLRSDADSIETSIEGNQLKIKVK